MRIAQFGILLLLLLTGMETDLKLVRQTGTRLGLASLTGIVVPFACGVALGESLPDSLLPDPGKRLITSLFLGTALSIASVKIVAMVVREMNFMRRTVGQVILASAIIDDTVGWIIIAIIFSLALQGQSMPGAWRRASIGTLVFMGVEPDARPARGVLHHPLGQRHFRQRIRGHHRDPGHHGRDGADHPPDRRAYRAWRLRRRHSGRRIPDPDPPYRRAIARPDHRLLHAGVLRHRRAERRPHRPQGPVAAAADSRADRDRQPRQVRRRLHRRRARRPDRARSRLRSPAA